MVPTRVYERKRQNKKGKGTERADGPSGAELASELGGLDQ